MTESVKSAMVARLKTDRVAVQENAERDAAERERTQGRSAGAEWAAGTATIDMLERAAGAVTQRRDKAQKVREAFVAMGLGDAHTDRFNEAFLEAAAEAWKSVRNDVLEAA